MPAVVPGPSTGSERSLGPRTEAFHPGEPDARDRRYGYSGRPGYDEPYGDSYDDAYSDAYAGTTYGDDAYGDDPYGDDMMDDGYGYEGDDEDEVSAKRGLARLGLVVGIVLGTLLALILLVGFWVHRQINPSGSPGESVTVELQSGQSTAGIAQVLSDANVIGDARVFTFYARFRSEGDIQAGIYELQTNMAMGDVLTILAEGPEWDDTRATIREGLTVDETIELLADNVADFDEQALWDAIDDLQVNYLPEDETSIEGMLYPDTYSMDDGIDELAFLQMMVNAFEQVYEELDVEAGAAALDVGGDVSLSAYEVLIVASMIEKEARVEEDRAKIARVIYNRLAVDRALQIDATSCYDKEGACYPLSSEDLRGPYSTRHDPGLPPTPIASPGAASIRAAIEPAEGSWDHYVLDVEAGDGSHFFTDDDQEFEEYRQKCVEAGDCG